MNKTKLAMVWLISIILLFSITACSEQPSENTDILPSVEAQAAESAEISVQPLDLGWGDNIPVFEHCSATIVSTSSLVGDINGDSRVSIVDIVLLNAHVNGKIALEYDILTESDYTQDGKIDSNDVRYLQGIVLGHSVVVQVATPPTCTTAGLTEGMYCSACQRVLVEQDSIAATGHNYINGQCHCGAKDESFSSDPQIIVGNASAQRGDTISITVALKNNPGVALMEFKIAYDSACLTLTDLTFNSEFGGSGMTSQKYQSPISIIWYNGKANSEGDMTFITLTFSVSESAPIGDTNISVSYSPGGICDINEEDIAFEIINGKVTVS